MVSGQYPGSKNQLNLAMAVHNNRQKPSGEAAVNLAKEAALRFLAHRNRSESEVRRRLGPHYSAPIVEQVVQWLQTRGYVDDAVFAKEWRLQREHRRPRGEGLIRHELLELGIDQQVVDQALEGFDAGGNAYQAACSWSSRQSSTAALDYVKWRRRLWGYLQRRGFGSDLIGETVQRLWNELSYPLDSDVNTDGHEEQSESEDTEPVG